jgi:hypothetical protein
MIPMHILRITLLTCLLAGCSAQLLEDVGEITPPRLCSETTKLFSTFSMRATRISWQGDKSASSATLTLELAFHNDKNFPIALSNSGNGVHYSVRFTLQGKGDPVAPKEATGIVQAREARRPQEPRRAGPFGAPRVKKSSAPADNARDVNFRITPNEPQEGKLVFQLPRDNYLLTVERKFADKPVPGQPTDHIAVCKIPASDTAGLKPTGPPGMSGVY